jgi:hypothetical protein
MYPSSMKNLIELMSTQQLITTLGDIGDELIADMNAARHYARAEKPEWTTDIEKVIGVGVVPLDLREYGARIHIYVTELERRAAVGDREADAYLQATEEE